PTHLDLLFFFQQPRDHRPPHSFPTRRSSDLTKQSPLFSRPGANATNGRLFLDISIETVATGGFITNLFAHWTNWFVPAFQTWPAAGAMIASGPTTARSRFNRPSETHRSHGPGKSGPGSTDATDD